MGPLSDRLRADLIARQGDLKYPVEWTGFGEYLEYLEKKGVAPNVASFVGATTVRINVLGYDNRQATPDELARMQAMVRTAMEEGGSASNAGSEGPVLR